MTEVIPKTYHKTKQSKLRVPKTVGFGTYCVSKN